MSEKPQDYFPKPQRNCTFMNFISGGYMSGTSTLEVYDADILSAVSGLIVTSMQYRYRTEDSHTCLHM